jgi:hypothetical protein
MKDYESAFPVFDSVRADTDHQCIDPGMTKYEYAAIHLKVPRSGDKELDDMIRQSRRAEFAKAALGIIAEKRMSWPESNYRNDWQNYLANDCFLVAEAMLAEWEKEAVK